MAESQARFTAGKGSSSTDSSSSSTKNEDTQETQDKKETPDIAALVAEIKDLKDRVEGQSRIIGKIQSTKEKDTSKSTKEDATLTERIKEIEADKEIMRKKSAREAISKALIQHGVEAEYADKKARVALEDLRDKIQVDKEYEVAILDGEKPVTVSEYIGAYLKTEGRWLMPTKNPPNDRGSARGSRTEVEGKVDLAYEDYRGGKYSMEKMGKGLYNILPPNA